ncbi:MAG: class I SAM-dependent methyltransferase [Bacteroidales bacterium]
MEVCPLCDTDAGLVAVEGPDKRSYHRCPGCRLIFSGREYLPSPEEERERYLEHNNGIEYPGYVNFLNQAIEPALPLLSEDMTGLDYGCGPVPTLSLLLKEKGISCLDYDPLFFPELPEGPFDFIFATECFEHLFNPAREIESIIRLLKPIGLLIVMTHLWEESVDFASWYYPKDNTHVTFYHAETFRYIEERFGFRQLPAASERVIILKLSQQSAMKHVTE